MKNKNSKRKASEVKAMNESSASLIKEIKYKIAKNTTRLNAIKKEIQKINNKIQDSIGNKQEKLHKEIAELKCIIPGLVAKLEVKEQDEELLYREFQKKFTSRNSLQDEQIKCEGRIETLVNKVKSLESKK